MFLLFNRSWIYPFQEDKSFGLIGYTWLSKFRCCRQATTYFRYHDDYMNLTFDEFQKKFLSTTYQKQVLDNIFSSAINLVDSRSFWNKKYNQLLSLITQKGFPTLFISYKQSIT